MITDKEYPATHSMSTAWYAVDDEGNVAMLYFEDNGPIPQLCPEGNSIQDIITMYLNEAKDGIVNANFTNEQADILISRLRYVSETTTAKDFEYDPVLLQIAPEHVNAFMEIMTKYSDVDSRLMCINENRNLYLIEFVEEECSRELYERKVVLRFGLMDLTGIYEIEEYEPNFDGWPYFVYYQDYSLSEPAVRAIVPRIPLKLNQISKKAANHALRISGNFNQISKIQLCSLFPFKIYGGASKKHHGFIMPDENGVEKIYSSNTFPDSWIGTEKDPNITNWKILQGSDEPRCLYLNSPLPSLDKAANTRFLDTWQMWYVYNILHGSDFVKKGDYDTLSQELYDLNYSDVVHTFPNVRRNLEEIVDFLQPWAIVAQYEIIEILKEYYEVSNHAIIINGKEYPFYVDNDISKSDLNVLQQYFYKPYRGKHFDRVRPLKEGDVS